jgi:serine protease Do
LLKRNRCAAISSNNRKLEGVPFLQHSAAVNPGNSGGPLLNDQCRVVGIVTLKAKLENVSFAIPVERSGGFLRVNDLENALEDGRS